MSLPQLAGFPMVMAVAEYELNRKLGKEFKTAKGSKLFPEIPWKMSADDKSWHLELDSFKRAPNIDFNVDVKNGCRVRVFIKTGTLTFSSFNAKGELIKNVVELDDQVLSYTRSMSDISYPIWNDYTFSIQNLFLELTNMHAMKLEVSNDFTVAIAGKEVIKFRELIAQRVEEIAKKNKGTSPLPFFGIPNSKDVPDTKYNQKGMDPGASTFSTLKILDKWGKYESGDLHYLLMVDDDKKLPKGDGVGEFKESLRNNKRGTLVISETMILKKYVAGAIGDAWNGIPLKTTPGSFTGGTKASLGQYGPYSYIAVVQSHDRTANVGPLVANINGSLIGLNFWFHSTIYDPVSDMGSTFTAIFQFNLTSGPFKHFEQKLIYSAGIKDRTTPAANRPVADAIAALNFQKETFREMFNPGVYISQTVWSYTAPTLDNNLYIPASHKD